MEEAGGVNPEALNTAFSPQGGSRGATLSARCHRRIFPCSIGFCCPCLCSSWKHIKDWLHLVLIVGVLSSVVCVVLQIIEITSDIDCHSPACIRQWVSAVIVLPSVYEFIKFIHNYDESLQEHQQKAEDEVHNLIDTINKQVQEMQALCGKLTENATDFAQRSFDSKRDQFETFIRDVKHYYKDLYVDPEILEQLRRFVKKWLRVFGQSLLDPEPLFRGLDEEMSKCTSVTELCEKVTGRLTIIKDVTRIQMVPSDSYMLNAPRRRNSLSLTDSVVEEAGLQVSNEARQFVRQQPPGPEGGTRKCGVSWFRLGFNGHFGRQVERTRDGDFTRGFPLTVSFCCGSLTILSRRHLNFLIYFLIDVILITLEALSGQVWSMLLVIANGMCVVSILACFEQIDEIAQLQRKIHCYTQRRDKVQEQHRKANENYDKILQLQDLWNYRTMPFLGIMSKVHRALEDKDRKLDRAGGASLPGDDQRLEWFRLANESMEALDMKLGPVKDWTMPVKHEWKETIGKQLRGAEHCENVDELIGVLPLLTQDLRGLEDGPPASSASDGRRPSGGASSSQKGPRYSPLSSPRTAPAA